jgi:hypothetical protein
MSWKFDPTENRWYYSWKNEPTYPAILCAVFPALEKLGISIAYAYITAFHTNNTVLMYTINSRVEATGEDWEALIVIMAPTAFFYRTETEVATMEYLRNNTSIPVPVVYAYCSSVDSHIFNKGDNILGNGASILQDKEAYLGLEWVLMEKMANRIYSDVADRLAPEGRTKLVRVVAKWVDQLARIEFDKIGSIYMINENVNCPNKFSIGPIATQTQFIQPPNHNKIYAGPYKSILEFCNSLTLSQIIINRKEDTENISHEYTNSREQLTRRSMDALNLSPYIFKHSRPMVTRLQHTFFDSSNIMIDRHNIPVCMLCYSSIVSSPIEAITHPYPAFITNTTVKDGNKVDTDQMQKMMENVFVDALNEVRSPYLEAFNEGMEKRWINACGNLVSCWDDELVELVRMKAWKGI